MDTFGKRLAECRKAKSLSQKNLAKAFNTSHTTIGKYERDEMTPSIEAANKLANILETSVADLLGETEKADLFKDPVMLKRLSDIEKLDEKNKTHILSVLDGFLQSVKIKNIAAL
jgi:transcriptional regulator with XRE-family HTH domain